MAKKHKADRPLSNPQRGAARPCNALCRMDCYIYGCPEAGTPCCKLFGRLPDFGGAA